MLDIYDKLISEKKEIEYMVDLINVNNEFEQSTINTLRVIIKYIIFFKVMIDLSKNGHYDKSMFSDLMLLMNSLSKKSNKVFYTIYRSFIENYIRFILELNDKDNTGIRKLFKILKSKYCFNEYKNSIDFIEGEYGKCCNFVHSNIKANQKMYEYYNDLIEDDKIRNSDIKKVCLIISEFLKKSIHFLIEIKADKVDEAFYKKKQLLKYLISENDYNLFAKKINLI